MLYLGLWDVVSISCVLVSLGLDLSFGSSFVGCVDKFVGVRLASDIVVTHMVGLCVLVKVFSVTRVGSRFCW